MPKILSAVLTVATTLALCCSARVIAADNLNQERAVGYELICLTEQPAIVEGESPMLRAWVATADGRPVDSPTSFEWQVEVGRIESQAAATRWDLSMVRIDPLKVRKLIATVKATGPGELESRCSVEVLVGSRNVTRPDRGNLQPESLFSAKRFLLPGEAEASGYGLYSYLLFAAPPKDAEERERHLKTIEACLLVLQDVDDYLRRHVQPKKLNATFIPLKRLPSAGKSNAEWAANVLDVYDYTTAQILLSRVQQVHSKGPYLLSVLSPLSEPGTQPYLWEDFTGVVPEQAWDWIKSFTFLTAQERSWSEASLERFGRKVRNWIAVGGKVTPPLLNGLERMVKFELK